VISELWELEKAGTVTKNGPSWELSGDSDQESDGIGEMPAPKVTEQHLLGTIEERGPLTANELAALFCVTSRKVASTLAMATKKSHVALLRICGMPAAPSCSTAHQAARPAWMRMLVE
jgi:Protein of unknown function (DUF1627).